MSRVCACMRDERVRIVLATALLLALLARTVNDLVRQTHINHRLIADLTHLAPLHRPRLPQPLDRPEPARRSSDARGRLRQHQPGPAESEDADLPGDLGAGARRPARGARGLVPARARRRRPARHRYGCFGTASADGEAAARGERSRPRAAARRARSAAPRALPAWWPLAALTLLAAALRLSTLDLQSFWYDEAFTPVHVLHPSLWATLRSVVHTENTPPLWYVIAWADSRVLGTGEVALRLPSALAGIATVPVAWAIGRSSAGRRATAIARAALVAVNPLFVWYSQEARAYGLFVLCAALAMLCFLRAEREPTPRRWRRSRSPASLALLTHYFAVFLLVPMVLWLLCDRAPRRAALPRGRARSRSSGSRCCR